MSSAALLRPIDFGSYMLYIELTSYEIHRVVVVVNVVSHVNSAMSPLHLFTYTVDNSSKPIISKSPCSNCTPHWYALIWSMLPLCGIPTYNGTYSFSKNTKVCL